MYLFSVWLHIVAAAIWLGGMVFLALVLAPVTRQPEHRGSAAVLISQTGKRFRWVGWGCLLLLLGSGVLNLLSHGFAWADVWSGQIFAGGFGHTLGVKLFLVAIVWVISIFHDFFLGPRATVVARATPGSPEALRLRRQASWLGRINLLLALAIIALGVLLVRG